MLDISNSDIYSLIHEEHPPWSIPWVIQCIAEREKIDDRLNWEIVRDSSHVNHDIPVEGRPFSIIWNSVLTNAIDGRRVHNVVILHGVNRRISPGELFLEVHWIHAERKKENQLKFYVGDLVWFLLKILITLDERFIRTTGWYSIFVDRRHSLTSHLYRCMEKQIEREREKEHVEC